MIEIIIIMCAGIVTGVFLRGRSSLLFASERMTGIAIYLLLFLLGLSVGTNDTIISNFPVIGFNAIILTFSAIAGSVLLSWLLYIFLFRKTGGA